MAVTACSGSTFTLRNLKELKETLVKATLQLDREAVADAFDPINLPLPNACGQPIDLSHHELALIPAFRYFTAAPW